MQSTHQTSVSQSSTKAPITHHWLALIAMLSLYFLFGFVTSINDVLIPHFKEVFTLTQTEAMLVQFAFFGAYFVLSIPASWLLSKIGFKHGLVIALVVVVQGMLLFFIAALIGQYLFFLGALFVIASGITVLQVAANPYLSLLGPTETGPIRLNMAGFLNSAATTVAPALAATFLLSNTVGSNAEKLAALEMPYLALAVFVMVLAVALGFLKLPDPTTTEVTSSSSILALPAKVWFGAAAIFFYVGVEVAVGSVLVNYLGQPAQGSLPAAEAAKYVSYYWGSAMIGRLLGVFIGRWLKPANFLLADVGLALVLMAVSTVVSGPIGIWAIVLLGLAHASMWPCIFPMALDGLSHQSKAAGGVLVSMVVGGAIIPLVQGVVIDSAGFGPSFLLWVLCYLIIGAFALRYRQERR